jgi:hypothetical protein
MGAGGRGLEITGQPIGVPARELPAGARRPPGQQLVAALAFGAQPAVAKRLGLVSSSTASWAAVTTVITLKSTAPPSS